METPSLAVPPALALLPGSLRSWGLGAWHRCTVVARYVRHVHVEGIGGRRCEMARIVVEGTTEPLDIAAERLDTEREEPLEGEEQGRKPTIARGCPLVAALSPVFHAPAAPEVSPDPREPGRPSEAPLDPTDWRTDGTENAPHGAAEGPQR